MRASWMICFVPLLLCLFAAATVMSDEGSASGSAFGSSSSHDPEPESCGHVRENYHLTDLNAVKDCFNSLRVPEIVIQSFLQQLEVAGDVYPYIDIANNPPSYPSQEYYGKVNTTAALEELMFTLATSERVYSNVYRAIAKFLTAYHDGHLYISVESTEEMENIFSSVKFAFPFSWNYMPDSEGNFHVYVYSSEKAREFDVGDQDHLDELFENGVYVETVDGEDAFEFFRDSLPYNPMRSLQGRLQYARAATTNGATLLYFPPDDDFAFEEHTLKFSNAQQEEYAFAFLFMNNENRPLSTKAVRSQRREDIDAFRGIKTQFNSKNHPVFRHSRPKDEINVTDNTFVLCEVRDNVNYMAVPTFFVYSYDEYDAFLDEAEACVSLFDQNANPIVVNFPANMGGVADLQDILLGLLNQNADTEFFQAVRKTESTKELLFEGFGYDFAVADEQCSDISDPDVFEAFWENTETDDYGNDIFHERTKFYSSFNPDFEEEKLACRLQENIRKPTDIIVVTDGICFSACSYLVNGIIERGSAIVAGVGGYNPDDELFVASQNPSVVFDTFCMYDDLYYLAMASGIFLTVSFTESFPLFIEEGEKLYPRDYTLNYIDKHLGVYPLVSQFYSDYDDETKEAIISKALELREEYQESCNPANQRLAFVTEECNASSFENAQFAGYRCGDDGHWNKTKCFIASCEYGYHVDFSKNECVPIYCLNPVVPPTSGSSSSSSSESPATGSSSSSESPATASSSTEESLVSSASREGILLACFIAFAMILL